MNRDHVQWMLLGVAWVWHSCKCSVGDGHGQGLNNEKEVSAAVGNGVAGIHHWKTICLCFLLLLGFGKTGK
jgi:hypothetical protein